MPDPNALFGDDSRPDSRPVYCYVVRQLDISDAPPLFLTSYDGEVEIADLPAEFGADDPQVFTPANMQHGPIRRETGFGKAAFEVRALTRDIAGISRYALTGAVPRVKVDIVKVSPGPVLAGGVAEWGLDTMIAQSGLMASFSFRGHSVAVECVPEPLFSGHEVPRWRFSRTCNHQLYGAGCGVDPTPHQLATNVLALDPGARKMLIQGTHASDVGNYFRQGVLFHQPTGMRLSVFASEISGTDTLLTLHQWSPDLAVSDVVIARPGCPHTFDTCQSKFSNGANFGGFSTVPNKNPTMHGI